MHTKCKQQVWGVVKYFQISLYKLLGVNCFLKAYIEYMQWEQLSKELCLSVMAGGLDLAIDKPGLGKNSRGKWVEAKARTQARLSNW